MSSTPNYASGILVGAKTLTTGDISRSAPSTTQMIFDPSVNGTAGGQVERILMIPLGTVASTVVRIFRHDGTSYHLYAEQQIDAVTAIGSGALNYYTLEAVNFPELFPILVPNGWTLRATINDTQASGVKVSAEGGTY